MPLLENKMVETEQPLRGRITEFAKTILFIRNREIDHPVYGQDIAAKKLERISVPQENTRY